MNMSTPHCASSFLQLPFMKRDVYCPLFSGPGVLVVFLWILNSFGVKHSHLQHVRSERRIMVDPSSPGLLLEPGVHDCGRVCKISWLKMMMLVLYSLTRDHQTRSFALDKGKTLCYNLIWCYEVGDLVSIESHTLRPGLYPKPSIISTETASVDQSKFVTRGRRTQNHCK